MTTTNYFDCFIEIAKDSPVKSGEIPPLKGDKRTAANLQFEMLHEHPYVYDSDEVLFSVFALRKGFSPEEMEEQRANYFSKGQPCFRASPLTKRYGWGIHSDENGKIAMYGVETKEYKDFAKNKNLKVVSAMRSKRTK